MRKYTKDYFINNINDIKVLSKKQIKHKNTIISFLKSHRIASCTVASLFMFTLLAIPFVSNSPKDSEDFNTDSNVTFINIPIAETTQKMGTISIPNGIVKANPFVPYGAKNQASANNVPSYTLVEPPESVNENSDAARVMDTTVSGILYDKYSPSAILNIEGNDYLVKKGEVVNNYKVLNISPSTVTVKLGSNVYSAGIGEILTEGSVNKNNIANLSHKFGGRK